MCNVAVNCIWSYMNCSSGTLRGESECRERFSLCSQEITQEDQWKGLPSVPGLDLQSLQQSQPGYISCLLLLYNCSAPLTQCREEFSQCALRHPVQPAGTDSGSDSAGTSQVNSQETSTNNERRNDVPAQAKPSLVKSSNDVLTPSLAGGSGKIPESKFAQLSR